MALQLGFPSAGECARWEEVAVDHLLCQLCVRLPGARMWGAAGRREDLHFEAALDPDKPECK